MTREDFWAWLGKETIITDGGLRGSPEGAETVEGVIALALLPVDFTRAQAMRAVSHPALKENASMFAGAEI